MPTIAYLRPHGANDFPLHFSFFDQMEKLGVLDRFDFLLDTSLDPFYCAQLARRFPRLKLLVDESRPRRWMQFVRDHVGRGYRPFAFLDKFDAVCEAPGGRFTELYMRQDAFRFHPRTRRRAILFHSIEEAALRVPEVRDSVASCELVIARTDRSAANARAAGAKHVVESSDIVFANHPMNFGYRPGLAVALRLPNRNVTEEYKNRIREIHRELERRDGPVDLVRIEEPLGAEMALDAYGSFARPNTGLYHGDALYQPFLARRDAVVSSRLHTSLLALACGNRKLLQYQIEDGTNKIQEILEDMGLRSVPVHRRDDVTWANVERFLDSPHHVPEEEAGTALDRAKARTRRGLDALLEWLDTIK